MSNVNILNLPVAVSLSGAEYFPVVQGGTTKRAEVGLLFDSTESVEPANTVLAGPTSGADAAPSFRALVLADLPTISAAGITVGSTVITSGATTRILYDNSGVLGEYTITGTGTVVAMQTSPTFNTSIIVGSATLTGPSTNVLGIGGSTSSFPAIKRSSATLAFRLADDSADAAVSGAASTWSGNMIFATDNAYDIGASGATRPRAIYVATNVTAGGSWVGSGDVRVGAASQLYWTGKSLIGSSADGLVELYNNAGTGFTRLNFGGASSSFPALGRSGTGFAVQLADGTAGGFVWVGGVSSALTTLTGASDGIRASAANVTQFAAENTTASSASSGGFVGMYSNDGAAMASGDRLGGIRMGGSSSASAIRNAALIAGFADETWTDASAYGSRIDFQTVTNTTTTLSTKASLSNAGVWSTLSGLISYNATATPAAASAKAMAAGGSALVGVYWGTGSPNTALTAAKGSLYLMTDGSAVNNRIWVNTDGSTAWTYITTGA